MMKRTGIVLVFIFGCLSVQAQDYALTDSLKQNLAQAKSPAEKIMWLRELSSFYMGLDNKLSDDYGSQQLEIAELSRDRKLMLEALLSNSGRYFNSNGVQANINKARQFAQKALDLAQSSHLDEYTAWAYMYLARVARNEGENDKALTYNTLAVSIATPLSNDSLKISAFNSLGNTYLARKEKLLAFRNFVQGLNLAEAIHNYDQMRNSYNNMSTFYVGLEDFEKAKDYLFKLQKITIDRKHPFDRLNVYRSLGKIYSQTKQYDIANKYFEKMLMLSDTIKLEIYKLNAYFDIISQYLVSNQGQQALDYFKEKPELKYFLSKAGIDFYYNQAMASAYTTIGQYDSAGYYFRKAEQGFKATSKVNQYWFDYEYASYFKRKGDHQKALEYWTKAKKIGEELNDIELLQGVSANLDTAYQKVGDYKNAYLQKSLYHHYKDSLQKLSTEKDLMVLEVDNENKRKESELQLAEASKRERHNIQYMGITAGIAGVFIVLVMMGTFSVSKTTIRILGFFAFIFLFEFIILLADNEIHHWTHGEPWKILAIKIALISILLPLHHFLEERVIHYLTSRKLIEMNAKGLLNKISGKSETDPVLK